VLSKSPYSSAPFPCPCLRPIDQIQLQVIVSPNVRERNVSFLSRHIEARCAIDWCVLSSGWNEMAADPESRLPTRVEASMSTSFGVHCHKSPSAEKRCNVEFAYWVARLRSIIKPEHPDSVIADEHPPRIDRNAVEPSLAPI